jgi:hypothetical protein
LPLGSFCRALNDPASTQAHIICRNKLSVIFMIRYDTYPATGKIDKRTEAAIMAAAERYLQKNNQVAANPVIIRSGG